ncbi:hypothetical protein GGR28_001136 [Lewinella aquimaris]|uniref:NADH:ubiquinone oxidoreductase intermediate-associated protein 30 domain-containing protein n=1 Tax=Neolewinella aquimaris TaxID=1835722 RepID=A0A840E3I5_9BACT|nr:CIA30 family protein [Neolewinella aquimaris]MBB4078523.1 hypothetical protein [Neolewinella aquimaris]
MTRPKTLYAFNEYSVAARWRVVDDIVMGGRSEGHFAITKEKHGRYFGKVSLDNGGGFSSVRHAFVPSVDTSTNSRVLLRLKGDGSPYQFRVRPTAEQKYSYTYAFPTTGDWEVIDIPFSAMYPVYRGNRLEQPNFDGRQIAEIAFLINNGKAQSFQLLLDRIELV